MTDTAAGISRRARELFEVQKNNCAEAVFMALNEGFDGGLSPAMAEHVASGLGGGLGGSGGTCGALTGAVLALGLVTGHAGNAQKRKTIYRLASALQERFRQRFGSSCCRDLIRDVTGDRRAHCSPITAAAAEMCAEILLAEKAAAAETKTGPG